MFLFRLDTSELVGIAFVLFCAATICIWLAGLQERGGRFGVRDLLRWTAVTAAVLFVVRLVYPLLRF